MEHLKAKRSIKRTADIYGWAKEYQVMGFSTFRRGWCQCFGQERLG